MDKLEPVIRHRFWILLGLSLPLIIYGYISASGAIKHATEERESTLEIVYGKVPGAGQQLPNDTWGKGLSQINDGLEQEVALARYGILEKQQQDMVWPPDLAEYVPDVYRGEFKREAGFIYVDDYENLLQNVYHAAEPLEPTLDGKGFTGKVYFPYNVLPRHEFGREELSISSERMWDAQEDLWILKQLFEAVRDVNQSSDNIAKARLRCIDKVLLMGGDLNLGGSAAAGSYSGEVGEEMDGMFDLYSEFEDQSMGDMDEMGDLSGTGGLSSGVSVAFDPSEELGTGVGAAVASANPTGESRSMGAASRRELRYIALDETGPYRERGFYLSVLINQQYIADFLITLSSSRWPIRIIRFQVGPNPRADSAPAAGGGQYGYDGEYDTDAYGYDDPASDFGGYNPGLGAGSAFGPYGPQQSLIKSDALKGAFNHPDLVQLEVLGAITIFNPLPEDVLAKVTAALEEMGATSAGLNATGAGDAPPGSESADGAAEDVPAAEDAASTPTASTDADATDTPGPAS